MWRPLKHQNLSVSYLSRVVPHNSSLFAAQRSKHTTAATASGLRRKQHQYQQRYQTSHAAVSIEEDSFDRDAYRLRKTCGTDLHHDTIVNNLQVNNSISQVYLYDNEGSEIYEHITDTDEYYLTNMEDELLLQHGRDIVNYGTALDEDHMVIELGSGTGKKTKTLIDIWCNERRNVTYVPIDISEEVLRINYNSYKSPARGNLEIKPIVGTFEHAVPKVLGLNGDDHNTHMKTFMYLGSSLGNLTDPEIYDLLLLVKNCMNPNDRLLIGIDAPANQQKPASIIQAAYNDAAGHTAAFTLNVLNNVNLIEQLDFDVKKWKHVAYYCEDSSSILTYLESLEDQTVSQNGQPVAVYRNGHRIFVERSRKFSADMLHELCSKVGLKPSRAWSTDNGYYNMVELKVDLIRSVAAHTKWLFHEVIGEERMLERPIELRMPLAFYYGHIPCFSDIKAPFSRQQEEHEHDVLVPGEAFEPFRQGYQRGIDPDVVDPSKCHAHSAVPTEWPSLAQFTEYQQQVTKALEQLVVDNGNFYTPGSLLALEHELMHQETLMYIINEMDLKGKKISFEKQGLTPPLYDGELLNYRNYAALLAEVARRREASDAKVTEAGVVKVAARDVKLGRDAYDQKVFLWDLEHPSRIQHVNSFLVSKLPVTNAQFAEFVRAGGYKDSAFWEADNFEWLSSNGYGMPNSWREVNGELMVKTTFDGLLPLAVAANMPAIASHAEAVAYCKFVDPRARLMSEAEYMSLFADDAEFYQAAKLANNNHKCMGTVDVGISGDGSVTRYDVADLCGNGWEWTSTLLDSHAGFEPQWNYKEYSSDFFGDSHFVVKGACPYTHQHLIRPSFRNWWQPKYRHVMAKFRICY